MLCYSFCFFFKDATLRHGWRTGAIIPELEKEITIINSKEFKDALRWLVSLEKLIEKMQVKREYKKKFIKNFFSASIKYFISSSERFTKMLRVKAF